MAKRASRIETETRLLDAVGALLAEGGFSALGVNAVCRRAEVNKALLYRYFGELDGLLRAYAERGDFWPSVEEVLSEPEALLLLPPGPRLAAFFRAYLAALRARPRTLEILAWEGIDRNELTAHLEAQREAWGHEVARRLTRPGESSPVDVPALTAIASAALHYLLIRGRKIRVFNGLDLSEEAGWARIEAALEAMLVGALAETPGQRP
ncbi:MAG: TetR/AcrR family transcriptional regulator [Alphaproteobacteria bacterium]|nr:TetR/AcrR family transcriptional regulator [Alphaproteobacteria bacterium]MCB9797431.1 TetR/AcrR family transcriptional regulator [Alphaproteobacteria bacterium]